MFEKAGFMLEEFGENTIKISGVPNIGYEIEYKSTSYKRFFTLH